MHLGVLVYNLAVGADDVGQILKAIIRFFNSSSDNPHLAFSDRTRLCEGVLYASLFQSYQKGQQ